MGPFELALESLDCPAKIVWQTRTGSRWAGYFDVPGARQRYGVEIQTLTGREWSVSFTEWSGGLQTAATATRVASANSLCVFSSVVSAVSQFLKRVTPPVVSFTSEHGEGRSSLYARLIKRFAPAWGYESSQQDWGNQDSFVLTRKLKESTTAGLSFQSSAAAESFIRQRPTLRAASAFSWWEGHDNLWSISVSERNGQFTPVEQHGNQFFAGPRLLGPA